MKLMAEIAPDFQDKKGFTTASVQKLDWWNPSMPEALHSLDLIVASDVVGNSGTTLRAV